MQLENILSVRSAWGARLAVVDQAVVSAANFVLTVLVARALGMSSFGQFVIIWSIIQAFSAMQSAVVIQPMMTSGRVPDLRSPYFRDVFLLQTVLSLASATLIVIIVGGLIKTRILEIDIRALPYIALLFCGFQMQEWVRRYLFAIRKPSVSLLGDIVTYGAQITFVWALWARGGVDIGKVLSMIAASFFLGFFAATPIWLRLVSSKVDGKHDLRDHLKLGKWLGISTFPQVFVSNFLMFLIIKIVSDQAVAIFRAVQSLVGVVNVLIGAIENAVTVQAVREYSQENKKQLYEFVKHTSLFWGGACLLLGGAVAAAAPRLVPWLYGFPIGDNMMLSWVMASLYALTAVAAVWRVGLRVAGGGREIFIGYLAAACTVLIIGWPLIVWQGTVGAAISWVVTLCVILGISVIALRYYRNHER